MQPELHDTKRHSRFSQTKFHDTTRIMREIPWYVKFQCEFRYVKFHGTTRITRETARYGMYEWLWVPSRNSMV